MKKIFNIIYMASFALVVASCNLDLTPSTKIVQDGAFITFADAEKFANGLNTKYRSCFYGEAAYTAEVQSEMFNASLAYGNRNGSPHRMDGSFTTSDYNLRNVWRTSYVLIVNVNNFISNIDKIVPETDKEKASIAAFKGAAYFYRASVYHDLVRRYGPISGSKINTADLGIPIITKVDITLKPARNTVGEVYEQIAQDIQEAKTYLASTSGVAGSIIPTIDAVKALEARVALYKGDYAVAASLSDELIKSGKYTLAATQKDMDNEWISDSGKECILQMYMDLSETPGDWGGSAVKNDIYLGYQTSTKKYIPDFIPTKTAIEMYESTDLRKSTWFKELTCQFSSTDYKVMLFNKYQGNPTYETAPNREYKHRPKVLRLGELYLINAEANAMSNQTGLAKTALNALQKARGASLTDGTMAFIQAEWKKEMIGEGYRIDCLRRWNQGFSGRTPQNQDIVTEAGSDFTKKNAPAGFALFTWAIPDTEIQVNPNLVQNAGW
ncbi:MAG: RagB/SusD family nutrient uptake outer membrane protein [Bacteroidales bacterium]